MKNKYITVTPHDFRPYSSNGDWAFSDDSPANTNAGTIRFYDGTEGFGSFTIPVGYKMTGYSLTFENEPSNIVIYEHNTAIGSYGTINTQASNSYIISGNYYWDVTGLSIESDVTTYVVIKFDNTSSDQCVFTGGVINITRCTSGCGQ